MSQENFHPDKITKYGSIFAFENFLAKSRLSAVEKSLLKIRISQINKCGFCEDLHIRELRGLGDIELRIATIRVWRNNACFTETEKTIFSIAEELCTANSKLSAETLSVASRVLDRISLAQVITIILVTNFWNKIFSDVLPVPVIDSVIPGYISCV